MSFQGLFGADADRAILELTRGRGGFTLPKLREELRVAPADPKAKRLANRLNALQKAGVLRTEGEFKRNRLYLLNSKSKEAHAFELRVNGSGTDMPNSRLQAVPEGAPIKRLARLAELDDLAATLRELKVTVARIDTRVAELHAGLFGEPSASKPTSS